MFDALLVLCICFSFWFIAFAGPGVCLVLPLDVLVSVVVLQCLGGSCLLFSCLPCFLFYSFSWYLMVKQS